jgi:hypothetical protein
MTTLKGASSMTHKPKILLLILTTVLLVLSAAYAKKAPEGEPLAIEFAMAKPFYVPASSASEKAKYIVIRVPTEKQTERQNAVTAIRLEPKMEGDKVRVTIYALRGDANNIITCKDWDALKANLVGTYLAGLDETVQLIKLKDYGVGVGDEPLTFRVVPRKALSPLPQDLLVEGCGCASCGGLICCPNPGYCLSCGACGSVCCKG